ncbi:MAG: C39 family peptidase [Caldilineaceae bacterium]|nr:C39 family peptidase [Caldilineaceae bacterium]
MRAWGYTVHYTEFGEVALRNELANGRPLIARVWTFMLDYWQEIDVSYVIVVVGYDNNHVYVNDPAFPTAPHAVLWDSFLAAWIEYDYRAALIYPSY